MGCLEWCREGGRLQARSIAKVLSRQSTSQRPSENFLCQQVFLKIYNPGRSLADNDCAMMAPSCVKDRGQWWGAENFLLPNEKVLATLTAWGGHCSFLCHHWQKTETGGKGECYISPLRVTYHQPKSNPAQIFPLIFFKYKPCEKLVLSITASFFW